MTPTQIALLLAGVSLLCFVSTNKRRFLRYRARYEVNRAFRVCGICPHCRKKMARTPRGRFVCMNGYCE